MYGECLAKYHFVERLRHATKHDLLPRHETTIQKLINQRIVSPPAPQNVVTDGVDKERSNFVPHVGIILQKGIGVGIQSVFVCGLIGQRVVD